jgi:uncharacterized protein YdaT
MPWNAGYYPVSMKNLPPAVRAKAIEIANALLETGRPEGQAIRIGIARAKAWAARRWGGDLRSGPAGRARFF